MEYLSELLSYRHFSYYAAGFIFCVGLFIVMTSSNLIKKLFGIAIFQVAVMLFFVSLGKVNNGFAPIYREDAPADTLYSNPLPHVLMLTAIVVGLACLSVGLALTIRIKKEFGLIEESALDD